MIFPVNSVFAAVIFSSAFVPASVTASSLAFLVSSSIFLSKSPMASVTAFNPSPAALIFSAFLFTTSPNSIFFSTISLM